MSKNRRKATKIKEENGVTRGMILITLSISILVLLLTIPNIYLDNHIYYESRNIAQLERIKVTLEEEQSLIKTKLEEIHYKDSLLNQDTK